MSIAAKAFLCASIVFQSTYAAVNRVITVEVAAEGAVAHRVVKGSAEVSIGTAVTPCPQYAEGTEYTRTVLENDCERHEIEAIVVEEVEGHHTLLTNYHGKLVNITGNSTHFGNHQGKHLVSLILGIQAAEAVIDEAEDLVAEVETTTADDETAASPTAPTPAPLHTRKELQEKSENMTALNELVVAELEEHTREIADYMQELSIILTKKTAHFGSHTKQDLIAVILSQQAVETIVEMAEELLEPREEATA